ncbi:hypothetical protein [Paraherbaspirillum soli]|uniref:CheA signal transduction histidine kinase n=1 Tax=Paraherbaspirillum soli TaxID=631222 RepID=A0ABW0MAM8_9BURK
MKRHLIGILVASIFTVPAVAHESSAPAPAPTSSSNSTSTSSGGAGGAGGAASGGSATGGTATNTVAGTSGANATGGTSRAAGGSANVTLSVTLPSTASGTSGTGTAAGATTSAVGDPGSSPNNTKATVDYTGSYSIKTTPNVVAPSLTTTLSDTCMGSVSFGVSVTGFGATAASTMVDQACVRRLDAREFRSMGMNDVALALLCQGEANRKAVESTGRSCPGMEKPAATAPSTDIGHSGAGSVIGQNSASSVGATSTSNVVQPQVNDPIIRSRLGMDPLPDLSLAKDH